MVLSVSNKFINVGKMLTILTTYNPVHFKLSGMYCDESDGKRLFWDSTSDFGNGRTALVKTVDGVLGMVEHGSYVRPTGLLAVKTYTKSVRLSLEITTDVLPDLSEETIFQASLIYDDEVLQRLIDYTYIHQMGITAYVNYGSPYFEHFMYKVAHCERMYKDA